MGEVVNLRRERKRRVREAEAAAAAAARARHGTTLAERKLGELAATRLEAGLDGARLEGAPADEGS